MLRFCNNATSGLKLNESLSAGGEYVLEGVFAELGVMNVNHRIYTEEEYLKHLQYLREDAAKGDLLGELDHPEDRFEVKMHEVSHQIVDIWYDQNTKCVMGKIRLLPTTNGELAKRIVDAGIPLHISSRAAGSINKDNTVSIQQIYTYDIVAKPGFSKATLHRVNESAGEVLPEGVIGFLQKSEALEESNMAGEYGMVNEDACINNINATANLRREAIAIKEGKYTEIDMNKLSTHINMIGEEAEATAIPEIKEMDPTVATDDNKNTGADAGNSDAEKQDNKDVSSETEETNDPYEVIAAEVQYDSDDDSDKESSDDSSDDKDQPNGEQDNDNADNTEGDENKNECGGSKCAKKVFDAKQGKKVLDRANAGLEKLDNILAEVKKKNQGVSESVKLQLTMEYPFTTCLNESDMREFANLTTEQKNKVRDYLMENRVATLEGISKLWKNGLNESATAEPVWLRYASPEYRRLYENASAIERENLEYTAKVMLFESQRDVDIFWENSGLKSRKNRQMMNESFVNRTPKISIANQAYNDLGYTREEIECYLNM